MTEFRSLEYGDGESPKAASLVAGFSGRISHFEPAVLDLVGAGYDVIAYEYDEDVLLSGDADMLPELISDISTDFHDRAGGYLTHRHTGPSLGGGIAWNIQKDSQFAEKGLYAAAGVDVGNLVMSNHAFRNLVRYFHKIDPGKEFARSGWTQPELSEYWSEIHEPPDSGFAIVLGGMDYVIGQRKISRKLQTWQEDGIDIRARYLPFKSHPGIIKWFAQNIPAMIELAD